MGSIDDGSMKKEDREKSLDAVREKKSVKVILISFKAGSTGSQLHFSHAPASQPFSQA